MPPPDPIASFRGPYAFLSNFYPATVRHFGLDFPSVEHGFQASKSGNQVERQRIQQTPSPVMAKRLGRRVKLRPDWEEVKDRLMLQLLRLKFADPVLAEKLLATGDAELVEGNTHHDRHYGVCHCARCGGQGENVLGRLLMQVRDELRSQADAQEVTP